MMKLAIGRCWFVPASLIVALCLIRPAHAQSAPGRVAVADPSKIFLQLDETKALQDTLEIERQDLEKEQGGKVAALKTMKAQLENLKPDSPQYADEDTKVLDATIDLQVWTQLHKANHERKMKRQMKALFDKIQTSVADIAAQRGYNVVLARQAAEIPKDLDALSIEQLQSLIARQNVLFVAKTDDISDLVINDLNAKYIAGR